VPETIAAEIQIGGKVAASLVPDLCHRIAQELVALDWGDGRFAPTTKEDLLEAREDRDGVLLLCLYDDQARWGEFAELETSLREHGIAFERLSDAKYEYGAQVVSFRPDTGLVELPTDPQQRPIVLAEDLEPLGISLSRLIRQIEQGDVQKALRAAKRAERLLKRLLPPKLPPLEPFEIVADEHEEVNRGQ
jgi:hypothetical protein